MFTINKLNISGKEVLPIVEGGKGVGMSNGETAGAFAAAGCVGTFSGVHAPLIDEEGNYIPMNLKAKSRLEKSKERIEYTIKGILSQIRIADKKSKGNGRIHMNLLWGMMGTEEIIERVLAKAEGKLHGITCGAGMPYSLGEICSRYNTYYYPIVSSMRAFMVLWKRSYHQYADFLGGVVYEDPWKAGGHNGLSNKENPEKPEAPYERVKALRDFMNKVGLQNTPIIMAGGVWNLEEYKSWIDNPELGPIAFQLGTRPMITKESPVPPKMKQKLLGLNKDDVVLNKFSPTGFYSSAVKNDFLNQLLDRKSRQLSFKLEADEEYKNEFQWKAKTYFINDEGLKNLKIWKKNGYSKPLKTPDNSFVFVTEEDAKEIKHDQRDCAGCLAACSFSSWLASEEHKYSTGQLADPRSFCIMKTLENLMNDQNTEQQLMFAGHQAFRFKSDPLYKNDHIPSIQELVDDLLEN